MKTPQGVTRVLKSGAQLTRTTSGELLLIGTVQDITAIAAVRSELHSLTRRLEQAQSICAAERLSPKQWARVEALIHHDRCGENSVRELAMSVRLKPAEFSGRFKNTTGEIPHPYLLRVRLERAFEALRKADVSIARIAADFGFFDQSHFTRHFKRRFGLTPAKLRPLHRE